jgi:thiaminase (transcriptional activator TenA)
VAVSFSAELRELTAATWAEAVHHRFVEELWRGELAPDVLTRYLVQDYQFVDAFVALLGATVAAADRPDARLVLARQLGMLAGPENGFFTRAFDALGVPDAARDHPELAEPTRGFIDLMNSARRSADYPTCLAVLLVAEWLYLDWATRPGATRPDDRVQREWIDLHTGPEFTAWVDFLRAEFDRVGARLDDAARTSPRNAFVRAVDLELAFFAAAYGENPPAPTAPRAR